MSTLLSPYIRELPSLILNFKQFLTEQGWELINESEILSIWGWKNCEQKTKPTIRLPNSDKKRIIDDIEFTEIALNKLAQLLNSSPEYILQAILDKKSPSKLGKISFRFISDSTLDGSIPLLDSLALLPSIKNLLQNFAKVAHTHRADESNYRPKKVNTFLNELRLGQTEKGSYVINIHYPIETLNQNLPNLPGLSFTECVQKKMRLGLQHLDDMLDNKKEQDITLLMQSGINSKICNNLEKLIGEHNQHSVEIIIHNQELPEDIQKFYFKKQDAKKLKHIAKAIYNNEYQSDKFTVQGIIINRNTPSGHILDGENIQIKSTIFGKSVNIKAVLDNKQVKLAEDAVSLSCEIVITGKIKVKGTEGKIYDITDIRLQSIQQNLPI